MKHKFATALRLPPKIREAIGNKKGSEVTEMVYSVAMLCILILSVLMILTYAIEVNAVTYAGKRIARMVEITGREDCVDDPDQNRAYNPGGLNALLDELLENSTEINAVASITNVNYVDATRRIQLREPFTVQIRATYTIPLLNPGNGAPLELRLPITVKVNGQSEIYWKT